MDSTNAPLPDNVTSDVDLGVPASSTPTTPSTPAVMKTTTASTVVQKRRSSTRSIKRKKFDDELVESSLAKTDRSRSRLAATTSSSVTSVTPSVPAAPAPPTAAVTPSTATVSDAKPILTSDPVVMPSSIAVPPFTTAATIHAATIAQSTAALAATTTVSSTDSVIPSTAMMSATPVEKKKSKSSSKRSKKSKPPAAGSTKDLGRWKPQDDLLLINGVQQTCDLTAVFHGVKFSCKFTLKEIQERWYALMYDSVLSKLAIQAMKQLHPDVIAEINTKALYSKHEEDLLKKITSNSQPTIDVFQECLSQNPTVFHPGRTARSLYNHWLLLKQYHLLPDQSVPPMPKGDHVLNFSDAEDMINEEELREPKDEILEHELKVADRRQKREIRHIEQELPRWQVLVDSVTGISPPDFDNQTLAVLRGRLVRYLMRSREITLGRATKDNQIDVDLSLEGPAWKISRKQGLIKLKSNGEFYLLNEGKRPLYIDGKPVLMGSKQKLNNNSVVEISCLRFIFLINQDLINIIRQESQK